MTAPDAGDPGYLARVIPITRGFGPMATADQTKTEHSAQDEREDERRAMERFQDRTDQGRREVRDQARREMGHFSNASRDAVRSFVRANSTLAGLMTPP